LYFSNKVTKIRNTYKFTGFKKSHSYTFSLPPGYTCPFKGSCIDYCYAIWNSQFRLKRQLVEKHNYYLLYKALTNGGVPAGFELIKDSIPGNTKLVRINDSGDYFCYSYMESWFRVAHYRKDILFYSYTKSLPFLYKLSKEHRIPENLRFIVSLDCNIKAISYISKLSKLGFRKCIILKTIGDYKRYKHIPFNGGEREAIYGKGDFKIAIHGAVNRFKVGTTEYRARKFYMELGRKLNIDVC
ncbi:unnamed protein product, partial [marine sediment metagenome]